MSPALSGMFSILSNSFFHEGTKLTTKSNTREPMMDASAFRVGMPRFQHLEVILNGSGQGEFGAGLAGPGAAAGSSPCS